MPSFVIAAGRAFFDPEHYDRFVKSSKSIGHKSEDFVYDVKIKLFKIR